MRLPGPTHHVLGFQHLADADRALAEFRERLGKFRLELHPDKTRRTEFGKFAEQDRKRRGAGKPEMFDFLGPATTSYRSASDWVAVGISVALIPPARNPTSGITAWSSYLG